MPDEQKLDALLRRTMAAPPELSRSFDESVRRRVQPRRLTSTGRLLLIAYAGVCVAAVVWALQDWPLGLALGGLAIESLVAGAAGVYAARLFRPAGLDPAP